MGVKYLVIRCYISQVRLPSKAYFLYQDIVDKNNKFLKEFRLLKRAKYHNSVYINPIRDFDL